MPKADKIYDVLVLHATSARDTAVAWEVSDACRASGLESVTSAEVAAGADVGDALRDALIESRALLMILPPTGPTQSMWLLIGAAQAWNKPIYALVTDPATTRPPLVPTGIQLYTPGRIQDVVRAVKTSAQQFTDEDRAFLVGLYPAIGASVDELALDPKRRDELVKRFAKGRGKDISGERLLSELLRLRKQGALPKKGRKTGRLRAGSDRLA